MLQVRILKEFQAMQNLRKPTFNNICFDTPLLPTSILLGVGILIGDIAFPHIRSQLLPLACIVISLLLSAVYSKKIALFCIGSALILFGAMRLSIDRIDDIHEWPKEKQAYIGSIREVPKEKEKSWIADVWIGKEKVRVTLLKGKNRPYLGDKILLNTQIRQPYNNGNPGEFDYATYLRRQGYKGVCFCYADNWKISEPPENLSFLQHAREKLIRQYKDYLYGEDLAVIAAMTLGDKSLLTSDTKDLFSETGTSHILALSGLHLGILFMLVFYLLRHTRKQFPRVILTTITLILIWTFVGLVGAPISLCRAALMSTIGLIAGCLRRNVTAIDCLSLAVVTILLLYPQALFDIGFQLSVSAVIGIVIISPILPHFQSLEKYKVLKVIYRLLTTSLCAQIGTAPLIGLYFHIFPTYSIISSIIVIPLASIILLTSLLFFIISFAQPSLAFLLHTSIRILKLSLTFINDFPYSHIDIYPSIFIVVIIYLLIYQIYSFFLTHRAWKIYGISFYVTLLFIGTIINAEQHKLSPKIIIYNLYKCPNIHFISNNHRSQIWISDSAKNSKNLTFIKKTFWKEYQLNPYIITAKSNTSENYSYFNFSGKTIIVLQENMSYKTNGQINVDLLYICKGYKQHLDNALKHITPKLIIIDNSLSDFYRNRLIKEAHKKVIKVHDIKRQGACILDLERQK